MAARLECILCHQHYSLDQQFYECRHCGGLLDVTYSFGAIDPKALKIDFMNRRLSSAVQDQSGVWRFRELLPFVTDFGSVVSLREGNTPLYDLPRLAQQAALGRFSAKHQGMNPTGSFKDNGMTTAITQAKRLGVSAVMCASTGNTSASMAAYAARAEIRAIVLIPEGQIATGKLAQAIDYGARVVQIQGDFDRAMTMVQQLSREGRAYLLNSVNPFRLEGQKTIVIELMEQRGWIPPDRIVLPAGNLGNCSAFGKALRELYDLKLINRLPRLTVVQAAGANPFVELVRSGGKQLKPMHADTLATAIKIGNPVSWMKALRALEWTNGDALEVSEEEIADARALLAREGIGCEPASAATLAGILKLSRERALGSAEDVVAILTGHQLKDPEYILQYHQGTLAHAGESIAGQYQNQMTRIPAELSALRNLLSQHD
jgi:threonine synthase